MAPRSLLPSKKRKHASDALSSTDTISTIETLEAQLIAAVSNKASLNPLADLLDIARNAVDAQLLSKAVYALYRVFVVVITNGLLLNIAGSDETKAVRAWIQEKLRAYVDLLTGLLKDEEPILKVRGRAYKNRLTPLIRVRVDLVAQDIIFVAKAPFHICQRGSRFQHRCTATVLYVALQANCQWLAFLSSFVASCEPDQEEEK